MDCRTTRSQLNSKVSSTSNLEQTNEETPASSSSPADHADKNKEIIVTSVRATDLTQGLRRIPAGFYIVVQHSGLEWRTENKRSSVNTSVVEWCEPIPMPSDLSATIFLEIYASFEFQPMLGNGEQLRKLTITMEDLLNRSEERRPFIFFPEDGDVISPCSSLSVTVRRRKRESNDPSTRRILDPHRSSTQCQDQLDIATDEGHSALSRYRKHGEKRDLERSVEHFERALSICPLDHPCRAAAQLNMATATFILYRVDNIDVSFDIPLHLYHDALSVRPVDHVDRPLTLIHLAFVHFARFAKQQDEIDVTQAEDFLREAIGLIPRDSHEHLAASHMLELHAGYKTAPVQLGARSSMQEGFASGFTYGNQWDSSVQLLRRYRRFGNLDDLQQAILLLERLVKSSSIRDPRYPAVLLEFCRALLHRFQRLGGLVDLQQAISRLGDAVDLMPDSHPLKPSCLNNLGSSFLSRFQRLGELGDLERAISRLQNAVDLTPDGHTQKPRWLSDLGASLATRFERLGELGDLERAISRFKDAVDLTPDGHPEKPARLSNLGTSFRVRFQRLGELSDLKRAISRLEEAVGLMPDGHPERPGLLYNLGASFWARFERLGELGDLERVISTLQDAVDLTPDGHPHKPAWLNGLGDSFRARFGLLGELGDLQRAISRLEDAVHWTPDGHPHKPLWLNNLSTSFRARFVYLGELGDLERAISALQDAVNLTPDSHPVKPTQLNNLGASFNARFERLGELSDLERAISTLEDAVHLTPEGHPLEPTCLNSLGISFGARFRRLGELSDLERAISRLSDAVDLTPDGHPDKPGRLTSLGISFLTRFERLEELNDLERAISSLQGAVDLSPDGHPDKPGHLSSLGTSLAARFERLGELGDLEQAILRIEGAVDLMPDGHPDKPIVLNNLGTSFRGRFVHLGELSDLERAISRQADAVDMTPEGHPRKSFWLQNLATSFRARFEHLGELNDLERAISLYSHSASYSTGPATVRFHASLQWISCSRSSGHDSLLHAYSVAVGLLPQLAWIGLSLTHRYHELMQGTTVVRDAAAVALALGHLETAVEWLEQGRSIVWGELFQLRSSYDELSAADPDLARKLRELSAELEHAGITRENSLSSLSDIIRGAEHHAAASLERAADRHRTLAIERDKLLQEIRALPGFERFLLSKSFSQLRASAHSGPVVILNAAEGRCDALIILADVENVIHVPLPKFNLERFEALQTSMKSLVRNAHTIPDGERVGKRMPVELASQWESILSFLWICVVKPVLDSLAFVALGKQSRIFWCPTGPFTFLPIHAAGFYQAEHSQPGHKVFDFVVSSYVPTLSILAPLSESHTTSNNLHFLAVRQPPSDGLFQLPGVQAELKHIRAIIAKSPSARTTLQESSSGTVEEVLELMRNADWVHFACHGIQDAANPTESGLCLADRRRLKLSNIIALSRPRGGLAFLSACQTATGDQVLSDEAIHIAAGMLFAGYGGVVGTLWSISDRVAPEVTKNMYSQLFSNGKGPDYREAARALQDAVQRLRDGGASFSEWIPFIHVGL